MNKKRWAVVLSFAFIVVCAAVIAAFSLSTPAEALTYTSWSGTGDGAFAGGDGSKDSPFLIANAQDLALFRQTLATYHTDSYELTVYTLDSDGAKVSQTITYVNFRKAYFKLTANIVYNNVVNLDTAEKVKAWGDAIINKEATSSNSYAFTYNGTTYTIGENHNWQPPASLQPQTATDYDITGITDQTTIDDYNEKYATLKKNTSMERFQGCFDGDGYTIYGLGIWYPTYQWVGFVGIGRYCTIKNLNFDRCYVNGGAYTGMIVGNPRVAVDIYNCTVGEACYIEGDKIVGGIAGGNTTTTFTDSNLLDKLASESAIPNFTISYCANYGTVVATDYAGGGILGFSNAGAARVSIDYCVNRGSVSAKQWAGGILGGVRNVDGYGHNDIEYCRNYGSISAVGNSTTAGAYAGGIVGKGCAVDVYDCVNYGSVSAISTVSGKSCTYVGGISGGSGVADNLDNSSIVYCYNYGDVTVPAESGGSYVGGIVGRAISIDVEQCVNEGTVTGRKCVGGIVGDSCSPDANGDVRVCYVLDCLNLGEVVATDGVTDNYYIAGIVGRANYYSQTIRTYIARTVSIGTVMSGHAFTVANGEPADDTVTETPDSGDGTTDDGTGEGTLDGEYDTSTDDSTTSDTTTEDTTTGDSDVETDTTEDPNYDSQRPDLTSDYKNSCIESDSCFYIAGSFTSVDEATAVASFSLTSVINQLGANWTPNYPYPTLNNLAFVAMEPSGEGGILTLGEFYCIRDTSGTVGIKATVIFGANEFLATCTGTEAGIVAAWADSLAGYPLTLTTAAATVPSVDTIDFTANAASSATFMYTDNNFSDTLVIRAYVKTTDPSGNTVYCYSTPRYTTVYDATDADTVLTSDDCVLSFDVEGIDADTATLVGLPEGTKAIWLTSRKDADGYANHERAYKKDVPVNLSFPAGATVAYTEPNYVSILDSIMNRAKYLSQGYVTLAADGDSSATATAGTSIYDTGNTTYKSYTNYGVKRVDNITIIPYTLTATVTTSDGATYTCSDTVYLFVIARSALQVSSTYANKFAANDNKFYLQTNTLNYQEYTISKNDGYIMYYNGTVFVVDGGNANTGSTDLLLDIREKFIRQDAVNGFKGSRYQTERRVLSSYCRLSVVFLITHYHSDHVGALRDVITDCPFLEVLEYVTPAKPTGTTAAGYNGHMNSWWTATQTAISNQFSRTTGRLASAPTKHTLSYAKQASDGALTASAYAFYVGSANTTASKRRDNFITSSEYSALTAAEQERYRIKIYAMMPPDYTLNSNTKTDSTTWVNSNSVWYMVRIGNSALGDTLTKALFTGDTYVPDTGYTYDLYYYDLEATAANGANTWTQTTGNTPVDAMIKMYGRNSSGGGKNYVTHSIDILECNHHGRGAYSENLFTITQPALTFTGVYYGHTDIRLINKAIQTGAVYVMGDGARLFTIDLQGNIDNITKKDYKDVKLSYEAIGTNFETTVTNADGSAATVTDTSYRARRVRHEDVRFGTGDELTVKVTWGDMNFTYTYSDWNTATHTYDSGAWDKTTADVTVKNTGDSYVSYKAEFVSGNGDVGGTLSGTTETLLSPSKSGSFTFTITGKPSYTQREMVVGTVIITFEGDY